MVTLLSILTILNNRSQCKHVDDDMLTDASYINGLDRVMYEDSDSSASSSISTSLSSKSMTSSSTSSSIDSDRSFYINLSQFDNLPDHMYDLGEVNSYHEIIGSFSLLLGCSMTNLDSIIDHAINLSTINRRGWDSVVLTTTSSPKIRMIEELGPM